MNILKIEGIGPVNAAKLQEVGVRTTEGLLKVAASKAGRRKLAAAADITESQILEWVNRADLIRIKGVGEEYSDLLEAAGVDTVKELRNRNPNNLHQALLDVNTAKKLVRRPPSLSAVQGWVANAKTLAPLITH
jgi:predicted flap endonuclease-1-like 5' DNA nuclease